MWECRACVLRCIRAIAGDAIRPQALAHRPLRQLTHPRLLGRRHASIAVATEHASPPALIPGKQPLEDSGADGPLHPPKKAAKKGSALTTQDKKHLELELKYLPDRVKLAQHVHYTLRNNQPAKALELCRLASKMHQVTVAWNHCIDFHMTRNEIPQALKIYNEMKKRAQWPDSYTYILLLRGLARPHHHGQDVKEGNVAKAMNIYNSMLGPTSRVRASVKHTNAVLKVCSAAQDMDALWGVIARMPAKGASAPDALTYTTLLNAMRFSAHAKDDTHPTFQEVTARKDRVVQEGRRIWLDVVAKWRGGEIHMDEELVCAMGRVLLMSRRLSDWDSVLDLVRQTMRIERLIPPLGHPERHTEHIPQEHEDEDGIVPEAEPEEDSEGYTDAPSTLAFKPVQPYPPDSAHPNRPTTLTWVQPGNATLSLLLTACTQLRIPKTAVAYWQHLTQTPYSLIPDLANFQSQLRLHAQNRSSALAARLLEGEMRAAGVEAKNQTFRLAMHACVRNKKSAASLDHAGTVVDVMERTSPDLDVHTLEQYLNLALFSDSGAKITSVLERLDPMVHNLRSRVTYGSEETGMRSPGVHLREKEAVVSFLRLMVGVIDTLMNRGLVAREEFGYWHARRSQLNSFVGRAGKSVEDLRGKVEGTVGAEEDGGEGEERKLRRTSPALKAFRDRRRAEFWGERRRVREMDGEGRGKRFEGVREWSEQWTRKRRVRRDEGVREWNGGWRRKRKEVGLRGEEGEGEVGFADSPMELSGRG